jgi:hypothetical protein
MKGNSHMFNIFFQASRENTASAPYVDKKGKCSQLYQIISTLKDNKFILLAHAISSQYEKVAQSHWADGSKELCRNLNDSSQTCGAKRFALKEYLDGNESAIDCDERNLMVSIIEAEVKKKASLYCKHEVINPCFEGGISHMDAPPVNCSDESSDDEFDGTFNGAVM